VLSIDSITRGSGNWSAPSRTRARDGTSPASGQRSRLPLRRGRRRHSARHLRLAANRGCVTSASRTTPRLFAARAIARWWHHEGCGRYAHAPACWYSVTRAAAMATGVARLENRPPDATRRCLRPHPHRGPLSHRRVQVEPHRAPPLLGNLQKRGGCAPRQLPEDLRFIGSTRTQSGLSVTAHLDRHHYPTGVETAPE
jgi:hypothetical protein